MNKQLIDPMTGEFRLSDSFAVDAATQLKHLNNYFGDDLKESIYMKGCWYTVPKVKIAGLYFRFRFYFTARRLKSIGFTIDETVAERDPWTGNHVFETQWIAAQMDDTSNFTWDLEQAGRHYHLARHWGSIGVYYDFKNGTFESLLRYRIE